MRSSGSTPAGSSSSAAESSTSPQGSEGDKESLVSSAVGAADDLIQHLKEEMAGIKAAAATKEAEMEAALREAADKYALALESIETLDQERGVIDSHRNQLMFSVSALQAEVDELTSKLDQSASSRNRPSSLETLDSLTEQEGEAKNMDLELAKLREELKRAKDDATSARKEVAQIEAIAMEVAAHTHNLPNTEFLDLLNILNLV